MEAEAFSKEIMADPKAGEKKYSDKWLELTGQVRADVSKQTFRVSGENKEIDWIFCRVKPEHQDRCARLSVGQKVRVTGKFVYYSGSKLMDCTIVELEPSKTLSVSAEDFAKKFETNLRATEDKYSKLEIIVVGPFDSAWEKDGGYLAKMIGGAKRDLQFSLGINEVDYKALKELKKGTLIEMRGRHGLTEETVIHMDWGSFVNEK